MTRIVAFCLTVTLALLICPAVDAQKKSKTPEPTLTPPAAPTPTKSPKADLSPDDVLLQELVEIMNKTESPSTFAVTVVALEALGGKARTTVPGIIRNAERLKIFTTTSRASTVGTAPSLKQEIAASVMEAITNLMAGRTAPRSCNVPQNYYPNNAIRGASPPAVPGYYAPQPGYSPVVPAVPNCPLTPVTSANY